MLQDFGERKPRPLSLRARLALAVLGMLMLLSYAMTALELVRQIATLS